MQKGNRAPGGGIVSAWAVKLGREETRGEWDSRNRRDASGVKTNREKAVDFVS